MATHPQLDKDLRGTTKTSYFLASRHSYTEICALLTALEEAENPGGVPQAPKRKPGMIPAGGGRPAGGGGGGGGEGSETFQAGGKGSQPHGKKVARGSSRSCIVM